MPETIDNESKKLLDLDCDVLCLYGSSKMQEAVEWLEKNDERFLVCIEDEESIYSSLPKDHPRIQLFCLETPLQVESVCSQIAKRYVFLQAEVYVDAGKNQENGSRIQQRLADLQRGVHLSASIYSDWMVTATENFYTNLCSNNEFSLGKELFGKFKNVPAIICGAGPSLEKNKELLKQLQDKALIFAGGAAINVLSHAKIRPHFGGGVDPETSHEICSTKDLPFFYEQQISSEVLEKMSGKKLLVEGSEGYPLKSWLHEKLGLNSENLDGGWTVGNFLTKIACELGCNPILFVGMDFAYSGNKAYSDGDGLYVADNTSCLVETLDIDGKKVKTQKDWLMASLWTQDMVSRHPDTTFINATEGGIGFGDAIPNRTLKDVADQYLSSIEGVKEKVDESLKNLLGFSLDRKALKANLLELEESLMRCYGLCEKNLASFEDEKGFDNELAYSLILEPIWNVWEPIFKREAHKDGYDLPLEMKVKLHRLLFFQQVLEKHKSLLERV